MSKEMSLFGESGNALVNSELFKSLQQVNKTLIGNSFGPPRRISLKGSKFRDMHNGEQIRVSKSDTMNIVIIDAAPVARTYYAGTYSSDTTSPPVCWSADTQKPAAEVQDPQSPRCADCPQNIKGSGQGDSRACRFSQRLAVSVLGKGPIEHVHQLQIPATSIFGDSKEGAMPLQGYAKFLQAHNAPVIAVVTEMKFDEDSEVPKLFFRAVRPLTEEELEQAVALRDHPDTKECVHLTVSQTDGVPQAAKTPDTDDGEEEEEETPPASKKKRRTKAEIAAEKAAAEKAAAEDDDDGFGEPTKVTKKAGPAPSDDTDLSEIVSGWDDE